MSERPQSQGHIPSVQGYTDQQEVGKSRKPIMRMKLQIEHFYGKIMLKL